MNCVVWCTIQKLTSYSTAMPFQYHGWSVIMEAHSGRTVHCPSGYGKCIKSGTVLYAVSPIGGNWVQEQKNRSRRDIILSDPLRNLIFTIPTTLGSVGLEICSPKEMIPLNYELQWPPGYLLFLLLHENQHAIGEIVFFWGEIYLIQKDIVLFYYTLEADRIWALNSYSRILIFHLAAS